MNKPAHLTTVEDALKELPDDTLHMAMARAFAEIEAATKDAINPHFKNKYADLSSVIAAIKPPLVANGLFFTQRTHPAEDGVSVETVLHHRNGETLSLGVLYLPADKRNAQAFGSALTYCKRYGLQTAFGVPTEDDDGNAAAASAPKAAAASRPVSIDDKQRDIIQQLASAAGKSTQSICEAYKVESLKDLTQAQAKNIIARLEQAAAPATQKEPVNA